MTADTENSCWVAGLRRAGAIVFLALITACGGVSDMIEEQTAELTTPESSDGGGSNSDSTAGSSDDSDDVDEGDPSAFRLDRAGWVNACTVISNDDVEAATGFTVLEAREQGGCNWVIESVDPDVLGESIVAWQPMKARQVDVQAEVAERVDSSIVVEPIDGLGNFAFWQGNNRNALGEVWVQTEQIGFRVMNLFSGAGYSGDSRAPLEALAAELAAALADQDVFAASGDAASALIPPTSVDLPEGITTMDGPIDELAAVPLPDGAVYGFGDVYPDRAGQDAYLDLGVGDSVRFFFEALPAAGFEITDRGTTTSVEDVLEYAAQSISFLDPEGRQGSISIQEGAFAPSQLNIQIFLP